MEFPTIETRNENQRPERSRLLLIGIHVAIFLPATAVLAADAPYVFRDVAAEAGLPEPLKGAMAHAAAWGDLNGDGWIDLFVGTYADRPAANYIAGGASGPVPNRLLINRRGRFTLSDQKAIPRMGRASGSVLADLDNDGLADLYVANNGRLGKENLLYHNRGAGRMVDVTARAAAPLHLPETARSVGVLDFDGDGLLDLLVLGSVRRSQTLLFRNRGGMEFELSDAIPGDATGLGAAIGDLTGN
ncbi:MAG: FG-GAP repeat domain-containing protein, partial [Planctomycetota bacterium]